MRKPIRFVVCAGLVSAFVLAACTVTTSIGIFPDEALVGPQVAVRLDYSTFTPIQGPFSATLDGVDITSQLQLHNFQLLQTEDAMMTLSPGTHTLSASAMLFNSDTQQYVQTNASSTFTVASPCFDILPMAPIQIGPNSSSMVPITVFRHGYDGWLGASMNPVDGGLGTGSTNIEPNKSSGLMTIQTGNIAPGTQLLLRLNVFSNQVDVTNVPSQSVFVPVQIIGESPPPTWAEIYNNYFAPAPLGPAACDRSR